jgi:hypothetical protein
MTMTTGSKDYTVEQFRRDLAEPYQWPGGYPRFFITADAESMSFAAARENQKLVEAAMDDPTSDWRVIGCDVNWEDDAMVCVHTGERIECAYKE